MATPATHTTSKRAAQTKTSASTETTAVPQHPHQFRLPKPGAVDPWWGANRSFWNQHILPTASNGWIPPIRSRVVRQPGARRAVRFILFASAAEFFRGLDEATARELEDIRAQHAGQAEAAAPTPTEVKP